MKCWVVSWIAMEVDMCNVYWVHNWKWNQPQRFNFYFRRRKTPWLKDHLNLSYDNYYHIFDNVLWHIVVVSRDLDIFMYIELSNMFNNIQIYTQKIVYNIIISENVQLFWNIVLPNAAVQVMDSPKRSNFLIGFQDTHT